MLRPSSPGRPTSQIDAYFAVVRRVFRPVLWPLSTTNHLYRRAASPELCSIFQNAILATTHSPHDANPQITVSLTNIPKGSIE
jgi:hypothetical protein